MIFYSHVQCEAGCDGFDKAMSHQASCLEHKKNDVLELFLRKENMAALQFFQFLKHSLLRFLQPFFLLEACISRLLCGLFPFFCSVFLLLGFVFQVFFVVLLRVFVYVFLSIRYGMTCIDANNRQSSLNVLKNYQWVLFDDTTCKLYSYKILSSVDGI